MTNTVVQFEQENIFSIENIAYKIKDNSWHKTIKVNLRDFMQETVLGQYDVKDSTRYQSRTKTIDYDFIDRQVNKITNTGDLSHIQKPTLIYFNTDTTLKFDTGDITYPPLKKLVIGGNHTIAILVRAGIYEYECNLINYEEYIKTHYNLMKLANQLNLSPFEQQPLEDTSIRWQFKLLMEECREKTGTHKPTREQQQEFLKSYPQVTQNTLNQLMSYDKEGGRGPAQKEYSDAELKEKEKYYQDIWPDHVVIVMPLSNWKETACGRIIIDMCSHQSHKVVLVLHSKRKLHDKLIATEQDQEKIRSWIMQKIKWANSAIDLIITFLPND